ncbi:MAG TPA: SH3 domain-containing protein [Alphaproteobacteria bacterium]|nr:SH3 domain-containing protein [Alphaproteobacteria bacterium]
MTSKSPGLRLALVICGVLAIGLGCSGTGQPNGDASGGLGVVPQTATVGREEVEVMRARLSRLQAIAQEALDAAAMIGATERELAPAQQALATAQQSWREGRQAFEAGQYPTSWDQFQRAEAAFIRAEEHAIRAGLNHIDGELTQAYFQRGAVETPQADFRGESVRVIEGIVNLRDGAGLNYRVIAKARHGEILQLLAEAEGWYRVSTEQGMVGWVSKALVVRVDSFNTDRPKSP